MNLNEIIKQINNKLIVGEIEQSDDCIFIMCEMPVVEHECPFCKEKVHQYIVHI